MRIQWIARLFWSEHLPGGFLGLLLLAALFERFVARNALDFRHVWGWDWRITGKAAVHKVSRCQILCLGDSLVKTGIVPSILESRLGMATYNLALDAGPPPTTYFLLRRAIEAGTRPRVVLVDFMPYALASDPNLSREVWPDLLTARECLELAATAGDQSLFSAIMLAELLPSLRGRYEIRRNLLQALRGEMNYARGHRRITIRNIEANRGAHLAPPAERFGADDVQFAESLYRADVCVHPTNATFLRRFFRLTAQHGVRVFWLVPPLSPEVAEKQESLGISGRYTRFLREVQQKYSNVVLIDTRNSQYSRAVHVDPLHLDRRGAAVLSADVAEVVGRCLNDGAVAERWFSLPRYRERRIAGAIEDSRETLASLRAERARRWR